MKLLFSLEQSSKIFPRSTQKLSQSSQHGKKVIEWRKIRSLYGKLSQKYLKSLYKKTNFCSQNSTSFFCNLESRLDVILYRAYFFQSIAAARQEIRNGAIKVNNVKVISPNYNLLPGDIISALPKSILPVITSSSAKLNDVHHKSAISSISKKVCNSGSDGLGKTFVPSSGDAFAGDNNQEEKKLFSSKMSSSSIQKLYKKKRGWRFKRSPFFLSLISSIFAFHMEKNGFKDIDNLKKKILSSSFLARLREIRSKGFKVFYEKTSSLPKKEFFSKSIDLLQNSNPIDLFLKKDNEFKVFLKKHLFLEKDFSDWFFSWFVLLLKKQSTLLRKKQLLSSMQVEKEKRSLPENQSTLFPRATRASSVESQNFYVARTHKEDLSIGGKDKNQLFLKKHSFFTDRRTKPLHLEISYRSLSIVFLFPPQRICFPFFINISQIYK